MKFQQCTSLFSVQYFSTFFAHAGPEALAKSAVATLVAFVLVDDAAALEATRVDMALAHRSSEEPLTTVARRRAIVFAGCAVVTYGAVGALCGTGRRLDGSELG